MVEGREHNSKRVPNGEEKVLNIVPLMASIGSIGVGTYLLIDDLKDFGFFSTKDHPSPLHHWQYGLILLLGGLISLPISILELIEGLEGAESQETS